MTGATCVVFTLGRTEAAKGGAYLSKRVPQVCCVATGRARSTSTTTLGDFGAADASGVLAKRRGRYLD